MGEHRWEPEKTGFLFITEQIAWFKSQDNFKHTISIGAIQIKKIILSILTMIRANQNTSQDNLDRFEKNV